MEDAHAKECRTREAESLEQAKHADHEDFKHLYETIAQQWRRLAEVIETGHASMQPPMASGPDTPAQEEKTDATPDPQDALRIDRPEGTDYDSAQVSSGAEEMERPDQVSEYDQGIVEVSPDAQDSETRDHQIVTSGHRGAQTNAGAQAAARLDNRISEIDRGAAHVSLDLESPGDQIAEANHRNAEVRPGLADIESSDDQISQMDDSPAQVSAGSGRIDSPIGQIVETDLGAVEVDPAPGQVSSGTERLESVDDLTSKADQGTAEVSANAGGVDTRDDQIAETDRSAAQISPGPESIKSTDDQSSENDHEPSTERVQTPFEWFLSSWFRGGRR
jgi:hypothetical protein